MRRSALETRTSLIAHCCLCAVLFVGCSDDDKEDQNDDCAGDAAVGQGCPDGSTSSGGSGGRAGSTGGSGSGGSGASGTGGSGASGTGGSGEPDEDGGATPEPDAGMSSGDLPMDGSQLAACSEDADCTEDRECYQPGAQQAIGYCTGTCSEDADCAALGDAYTCNAMGGGMGMGMGGMSTGLCRIECEGADDTSCPDMMSCVETGQGAFRCAYVSDPGQAGEQNTQLWEQCEASADCVEGLICYPSLGGGGPGGGGPGGGQGIGGFCTQPCESSDECMEPQPSGDIAPTCGNSGGCRFDCSEGGTCPDGMECEMQGGTGRCLYPIQ